MKQIYSALFVLFLFISCKAASQEREIFRMTVLKQYPEMRKRLFDARVSADEKEIYSAILDNVFGNAASSNERIAKILARGGVKFDSLQHSLLETQHSNYVKLFDYKRAYESKKYLMDNYLSYTKEENRFDEEQAMNIWQALQDAPRQEVLHAKEIVSMPMTKDPVLGLQRIPVSKGGKEYSFIFDTGAGISTIMDSMARVLGLSIYDKVPVVIKGGITGLGTNVKLGIADKLNLGGIEVRNVLFLVFPDSALTFKTGPTSVVKVDVILGFPVIKELERITLYADRMEIDNRAQIRKPGPPNMAIEYLKPIIYLEYEGEELPFTFDTGADETVFSEVFYKKHRAIIDKTGKKDVEQYGGAGGIKAFNVMKVPSLSFGCLGTTITLKDAAVSTEVIHTGDDVYYGNVGQDVIQQFKSMTIDFKESRITFNR